jgi:hypothetical protein
MSEDAKRRAEVNAIGNLLASLRAAEEHAVSVTFSALAPSADCRDGSVSVTIRTAKDVETAEAVRLIDALWMARARIAASEKKRAEELAKAKLERCETEHLPSEDCVFSEIERRAAA